MSISVSEPEHAQALDDRRSWRAVCERDRSQDGRFVYAVASTRVYCRPSCAARRPRRGQVTFYTRPEEAERAGYRACRRCDPRGTSPEEFQSELIRAACRELELDPTRRVTLDALSRRIGLSPWHLHRTFTRVVGVTPRRYAEALRVERLKGSLRNGERVTGALYEAGYGSSSRLYHGAGARLGMTPATYGRRGAGERIRYAVARTRLGSLLVARTATGVCAVALGGSARALEAALEAEFPAATMVRDQTRLARLVRAVVGAVEGRRQRLDLPLDVRASAFRLKVWDAVRAIPYGEVRTYGELARAVGRPAAVRAVARACAANPVALAIPCHRVVPAAGGPGGYRFGVTRKRRLLAMERERSKPAR